jgi:DNA topoisomerase-1
MEEDLDRIADGELNYLDWLNKFYFGASENEGLQFTATHILDQDPRAINSLAITDAITLRTGQYGPYLEIFGEPNAEGADDNGRRIVNIPEGLAPDELTPAKAQELVDAPVVTDKVLGVDPETGFEVLFKDGRFGPYVVLDDPDAAKPKTGSLFKTMDPHAIDLETALRLLSLPRVVGADPETGVDITVQNGKFGPYLLKGKESRSLGSEDQIFSVTLDEAIELYKQPKYGARRTAATPLREFGEDPASQGAVTIKTGQFGAYVTDTFVNATIPKDDNIEDMTADRAFELLSIRREKLGLEPGQAPAKSGRGKRPTTTRVVKRGTTRKK